MTDLSKLDLKISYSSDCSDMVVNFYIPCLGQSILYRRAVGYFTSSGLALAAQGVIHLLKNGGRILLIASPILTEEDIKLSLTGLWFRMNDKIQRLKTLLMSNRVNAVADEPMEDAYLDVSNYGIMATIVKKGVWGK